MRPILLASVALVSMLAAAAVAPRVDSGATLEASSATSLKDTDEDGLPDDLEFVAHSDPVQKDGDGDGRGDLLELIQHTDPMSKDPPAPDVDAFRVLLHSTHEGRNQQEVLWVHLLFRFTSGTMNDLRGLALFLDIRGKRYPLDSLLLSSLAAVHSVQDPTHGLLMRATLKIPVPYSFVVATPCTFGAYCLIGSQLLKSGSVLLSSNGIYHTLTPVGNTLVFQATNATQATNPFWSSSNRRCVFALKVYGVGRSGQICEIQSADCKDYQARVCTTTCAAMKGHTFFVPDGLSLILGG